MFVNEIKVPSRGFGFPREVQAMRKDLQSDFRRISNGRPVGMFAVRGMNARIVAETGGGAKFGYNDG